MRSLLAFIALISALFGCQTLGPLQPTPVSFSVDESTIQVIGFLGGGFERKPIEQMKAVPEGGIAYVYLFSLGGNPRVAQDFLDAMEGKVTVCFAHAAGGPAFTILQACTYRLVGDKSLVGNSNARLEGGTGDAAKDQEIRDSVVDMMEDFNELEADRLDLSFEEYELLLSEDGFAWQDSKEILNNKGADSRVDLECTASSSVSTLIRTVYVKEGGKDVGVNLEMTVCPVMRQLVSPDYLFAGQLGEIIGIPLTPLREI